MSFSQILVNRKWPRSAYTLEALEQRYFLSSGSLDPTFWAAGRLIDGRIMPYSYSDLQILMQSDGKILVGGTDVGGTDQRSGVFIARYNADGTKDASFSGDGIFQVDDGGFMKIAIQGDGKILLADYMGVYRLNPDGAIDTSFANHGLWFDAFIYDMLLLRNGKILVADSAPWAHDSPGGLTRLNEDGTEDSTFARPQRPALGDGDLWRELQEMPDGRILALIDTWTDKDVSYLARFTADGLYDDSFGPAPTSGVKPITPQTDDYTGYVEDIALTPAGDMYVLITDNFVTLYHYRVDGTTDPHFGPDGVNLFSSIEEPSRLTIESDGKILVATWEPELVVKRFNANGTIDPTFGENGTAHIGPMTYFQDSIATVVEDGEGRLVLVGESFLENGDSQLILARLGADQHPTPPATPTEPRAQDSPQEFATESPANKAEDDADWVDHESLFSDEVIDPWGDEDSTVWD